MTTSTLRAIKPLEIPGLKPAKVDGERPSLKWVAPTSLLVDATYQRDLSERSIRLIRRMIENCAWNRMKPPIVVQVGPATFHIVDGQHTAIAAASLGITEVPVFVVKANQVDERARAFVGHNSDRIVVSSFDIYRALLAAGDPDAQLGEEPDAKIVDVFICKARKKIAPFGIQIETLWGQGYRLPPASKAAAMALFEKGAA